MNRKATTALARTIPTCRSKHNRTTSFQREWPPLLLFCVVAMLLLVTARTGIAQPAVGPNPEQVGRALVKSPAVFIALDLTALEDEATASVQRRFRVLATWRGLPRETLAAPCRTPVYSASDTLLVLLPPDVEELENENRQRAKFDLPLLTLPSYAVLPLSYLDRDSLAHLWKGVNAADSTLNPLFEFIAESPSPWWRRAGEGALWQAHLRHWEEADSTAITEDALRMLFAPVSPDLVNAATSMVKRYRAPQQWEWMQTYGDTVSLGGREPLTRSRYGVLASWPHPEALRLAGDALKRPIEQGELPWFGYVSEYARAVRDDSTVTTPAWVKPALYAYLEHVGHLPGELDSTITELPGRSRPDPYLLPTLAQLAVMLPVDAAGVAALKVLAKIREDGWGILPMPGPSPTPQAGTDAVAQWVSFGETDSTARPLVTELSLLGRDEAAVRADWRPVAVAALAGMASEAALDTLLAWYDSYYAQRTILEYLVHSDKPRALEFVQDEAEQQLDYILALEGRVTVTAAAQYPISVALNPLCERAADLPRVDSLLTRFYRKAPPGLKTYALEVLFRSPIRETAEFVLAEVDSLYRDRISFSAGVLRKLHPGALAPWLADKILKPGEPGAPVAPQEALRLLNSLKVDAADSALYRVALGGDGGASLFAFAALLQRGIVFDPEPTAAIVFAPRPGWDARVLNALLADPSFTPAVQDSVIELGTDLLQRRSDEYAREQLESLAALLAQTAEPERFRALLTLLAEQQRSDEAASWARFGLARGSVK